MLSISLNGHLDSRLIEPRPVTQMDWILPVIAGIVGIITIIQMRRLIRSDNPSTELYRNMFESE